MTPPRATVIIPTFNGGPLLREVVQAVLRQRPPWPFELLVIDSSSTDGSLAVLEGTGATLITLPQRDFDHGDTRNQAARAARGETVVFLVQDASPIGESWLEALVEGLALFPDAAGAYARQQARPDADPDLVRRIEAWTPASSAPRVKRLPSPSTWAALPPAERIRLAAFDNVCSVIRRDHLLAHPFPRMPFGEDLCWGEAQLLAGRALVYLPGAAVWHSHRRSFQAHRARARLEHSVLIGRFGLRAVPDLESLLRGCAAIGIDALSGNHAGSSRRLAELIGQYEAGRAYQGPP